MIDCSEDLSHGDRKPAGLIGQRIGKLVVVSKSELRESTSGKTKVRMYLCQCDCGVLKEFHAPSLYSKTIKSCGCEMYKDRASRLFTNLRVGCDREHPNYNTWSMMVRRCYEENHDSFLRYGGSGIVVEEEAWLLPFAEGFKNFNSDMGIKQPLSKLDRIDNSKGYSKQNCRWVNDTTSVLNRGLSKNNTSGVKGITFYKGKWVAQIGDGYRNIYLGRFEDWFLAVCARKSAENIYHKEKLNDRL